ncbi:murein hydrolase activator EnvC family protein [Pseudochryseolinea flava]|uniref:Peptidase M23 n=1 Tax=Pseudochryseolinea flava TaxID=2059302 RepID=A0A364XZM0_9BACT|nr:peptidoglycan DD-metalloendopeptidase family protein [Pseudochryseolinea flava]RAV99767.1 peptidase M23 [Pseudochryseolinea flava]
MFAGRTLVLIFFTLIAFSVSAQRHRTKSQLQKEKQQNLERIKETEKILTETSAKKKNTLGELNALNQRIDDQEKLISSIKGEVTILDSEIGENKDIILALENDLRKLKKEFAAMLVAAQKANNSTTRLTFLFSAKSFDQLVMRMKYMEQYSNARKLQAEQIVKVQEALGGQVREIEGRRVAKNKLLDEELKENDNLSSLKKKQNTVVKSLQKEEKKLRKDLETTKKAVAALDRLIEDIIREERERVARASGKSSDRDVALSSSFEQNKNKFPWPSAGFVSQKFGKQPHPALKNIVVNNNGVNIQTREDEKVKCIFDGEVSRVAFIQAMGNIVIVKHGEYLTVYGGLKEVSVRTGQKVSTNQEIGKVFANSDGVSELRFQIFRNSTPLDPQIWLRNM